MSQRQRELVNQTWTEDGTFLRRKGNWRRWPRRWGCKEIPRLRDRGKHCPHSFPRGSSGWCSCPVLPALLAHPQPTPRRRSPVARWRKGAAA